MARISPLISAGEGRQAIIVYMATRQRATELEREIARRSTAIALALGREVRDGRIRRSMTQRDASAKIGMSQTAWSRIEQGLGGPVPLQTWVALGIALDRPGGRAYSTFG